MTAARRTGARARVKTSAVAGPEALTTSAPGGDARRAAVSVLDVHPHDPALLDTSRARWLAGDWQAVSQLSLEALDHHPDRARLALLVAAAHLQLGNRLAARACARRAVDWGCDRAWVGRVLLAGLFNTLGRASMAAGREDRAGRHFERAVSAGQLGSEVRRLGQQRRDDMLRELGAAQSASAAQRRLGIAQSAEAPAWLSEVANRCLAADDFHDGVDQALATLVTRPRDRLQLHLLLSAGFEARGDRLTALHFLNLARQEADAADPALRAELMRRYVALGRAGDAVDLVVDSALGGAGLADEALAQSMRQAYQRARQAEQAREEHGHELLLAYLRVHLAALRATIAGRAPTLVEIGTTRELVPGQGSTTKLAEYCREQHLHFITVDMDPHNAGAARGLFERLGVGFEAEAMKGEDYLRGRTDPIDVVFLDAYDFDHGKHSELRQSRYRKFLGASIDERQCHRMHLECAEAIVAHRSPAEVVCIDDTWLDAGQWTAKGTLAMPYLLEHGYELVEARNRAALLRRMAPAR